MEDQERQQRQGNLAHPNGRIIALEPEEGTGSVEENGIEYNEDDEGNAIAVQVLGVGPVVATWIEITNHVGWEWIDRVRLVG